MEQIRKNNQIKIMIFLMIFLLLAVVRTNYGLWNTDIPLGDEIGSIEQSFNLYKSGSISTCLYNNIYIVIFRYVTNDPIIASYWVRFVTSLASVFGLFLLLYSINGVNVYGAFIMSLLWNITLLNTPLVQYKNIHLFAFALSCFAGYFWLANLGKIAKACSLGILLIVIFIRPEYALLLFLLGAHRIMLFIGELKSRGWRKQRKLQISFASLVVVIAVLVYFILSHASQLFAYVDGYLFTAFKQCYTAFVVTREGLQIDPMTEFGIVMNKQFSGATGFFEALLINPLEMSKYFLLNGISNISHIYYLFANHSIFLPNGLETYYNFYPTQKFIGYQVVWFERVIFLFWIGFGSIWFFARKLQRRNLKRIWLNDRAMFIFSLAAVSITSLMLLIPNPIYWVMIIPLFFWGPAALISKYSSMHSNKVMLTLSVLISLFVVSPIFISSLSGISHQDKDVVLDLRERLSMQDKNYVKAIGYVPRQLLIFAIPGRWEQTTNTDVRGNYYYESLIKTKEYDLIIVDQSLRRTQQYNKEKQFFERLLQHPEIFGYALILKSKRRNGPIWIFQREMHKIYGPIIYCGKRGNAEQYQHWGWSNPEKGFTWTDGENATLRIPIVAPKSDIIMNVSVAFPFLVPGKLEKQKVIISINGKKTGEWIISSPGKYNLKIPRGYIKEPELKISFELPNATSPANLGVGTDSRKLALAIKAIKLYENK